MFTRHSYFKVILMAAACLFTADLAAQILEEEAEELPPLYTNEIELGVGYSSEDSFKFGEFTGLEDQGAFAIGNITLRKYSVIGDADNDYWELSGSNLGLDSRSLFGEYSHDGTYGEYGINPAYSAFIEYDQKPRFNLDDARSPFIGAGTYRQTLPTPWTGTDDYCATAYPGNYVADSGTTINKSCELSNVFANLKNVDVETQRYKLGGGFSLIPNDEWKITGKYYHEIKDGTETQGIVVAGRSPTFIAITPIEYDTDEFDLSLAHVGPKGQFQVGYHLSLFTNENKRLVYQNPFNLSTPATRTAIAAISPFGNPGQMGLPPDNAAHAFSFAGGYNLGQTTRATANLSYQRMSQDQAFLPYTINPFVSGPERTYNCQNTTTLVVTAPAADGTCPSGNIRLSGPQTPLEHLPRESLDGMINNYFANLTLSGRPLPKLNLTGRYTYDLRESDTPVDTYLTVRTDSASQFAEDSDGARVNRDYDREMHKAELDGNYRLMPRTTLSAGYVFEAVNRNLTERENTYEHTGKVKLTVSPTDNTNAWIRYLHAEKDGSFYDNRVAFFTGFGPKHVLEEEESAACNPGGIFDPHCADFYAEGNNSKTRKYYMADRTRDQVVGNFSFFPNDILTVGVTGRYTTDDYNKTELGLTDRDTLSATLDLSYRPRENLTAYAYYTYDFMDNDQVGCEPGAASTTLGPACAAVPSAPLPPRRLWEVKNEDRINTVGAGFEWLNAIEDKLDITLDFTYSRAVTETVPQVAADFVVLPVRPFPDVENTIYSLNLRGDYRLNQQTRLRFGYQYEDFGLTDWAFDNIGPTTMDTILSTGETNPNYTAHVVMFSVIYEFQ